MNRSLLCAGALLGTAVSLVAQSGHQAPVLAALQTADAIAVHANRQIDGARGQTAIERPLVLRAEDGRSAFAQSAAGLVMLQTPQGPGVGARFDVGAFAADGNVAGTLAGNPWAPGLQTYELTLSARQAVQGDLVIHFGGDARDSRAVAEVRVGRVVKTFTPDGNPQRDAFEDLTVDANGLTIAIGIGGQAHPQTGGTPATFRMNLNVFFVPDAPGPGCTVTVGQRSCPEGGVLAGAIVRDPNGAGPALGLGLTGALPDAIGLTIVSPDGQTFPIAMSNCVFFRTAILHEVFRTDAMGNARTLVPFPMRAGGSFSVQQMTVLVTPRGLRFGTSNTLDVACR
ncbi:MAG: hypothetical protein IPM29_02610 [Planctomycetes bacterium]|nr:hypothetical protein [Planctomycetota bacterium]